MQSGSPDPRIRTRPWDSDASSPVLPTQVYYMWASSIPKNWKSMSTRPVLRLKGEHQGTRSTLEFLRETMRYIDKIRKPISQKSDFFLSPRADSKRKLVMSGKSTARQSPIQGKESESLRPPQTRGGEGRAGRLIEAGREIQWRPLGPVLRGMLRKHVSMTDIQPSPAVSPVNRRVRSPPSFASSLMGVRRLIPATFHESRFAAKTSPNPAHLKRYKNSGSPQLPKTAGDGRRGNRRVGLEWGRKKEVCSVGLSPDRSAGE